MIRIGIVVIPMVLLVGAAFYVGSRWDDARDARGATDTLERIDDADISKGNADDDRNWVADFIDGLLSDD